MSTDSTWDAINVRALSAREELACEPKALAFVSFYVEKGSTFTPLLRPPMDFLMTLFKYEPEREAVVFYLRRHEAWRVLKASMFLSGGGREFVNQSSRVGKSACGLVTMHFLCIFAPKPAADEGAAAGGGAQADAAAVGAQARDASSTSTRQGGPIALGCTGAVKLVFSPTSAALAIVTVTPCSVKHDSIKQSEAHLAHHPLVHAQVVKSASSTSTGRTIDVSSLSKVQTYVTEVRSVELANSRLILAGDEPNVRYPSYPIVLNDKVPRTISYDDVLGLGGGGKYGVVETSRTAAPASPPVVASATKTMCVCQALVSSWKGDAAEPTIACAHDLCSISIFHRACVGVGADVLGARCGGDDSSDEEVDGVISMRWRCPACAMAIDCICGGAGAALDAPSIECTSGVSAECAKWYHLQCVELDDTDVPDGDWACPRCASWGGAG